MSEINLKDVKDEKLEALAKFFWGKGMTRMGDDVNHYVAIRGFSNAPRTALENSIKTWLEQYEGKY